MENFLIYKSSAGSGKTTALVKTMLWLSLRSSDPSACRRILAVTFTNKAASELKSRLLSDLYFLSKIDLTEGSKHHLVQFLIDKTGLSTEIISERAGQAFEVLLHDYHLLAISTIDKFNHRLIRSFTRDLNLKGDFEIETDEAALFSEAVDSLLMQIGIDPIVTDHLTSYIDQNLEAEKKVNIKGDLEGLRNLVLSESAMKALRSLKKIDTGQFTSIRKQIFSRIASLKNEVQSIAKSGLSIIQKAGFDPMDFKGKSSGIGNVLLKISEFPKKGVPAKTSLLNAVENDVWFTKMDEAKNMPQLEPFSSELKQVLARLLKFLSEELKTYNLLEDIAKSINLLAVLNELSRSFEEVCTEKNVVPISAFNKLISDALRKEPAGFIYETYGNRFNHILIDEYQDTSELQWHNLLPLIGESLSKGYTNLVVGDAKQSIYRWRGGKAEQLIQLPQIIDPPSELDPFLPEILNTAADIRRLDSNYRSAKNVVDFNNFLFGLLGDTLIDGNSVYSKEYAHEKVLQKVARGGIQGYVELNEISSEVEEKEYWQVLDDQIRHAKDGGYSYKDMAILVRRTAKEGRAIVDFLRSKGHPVDSSGSFEIDRSPNLRLIVNLLRVVDDETNEVAKLNTILGFEELLNLQSRIYHFAKDKKVDLSGYFKSQNLKPLPPDLKNESVFGAVDRIIRLYLHKIDDPSLNALVNVIFEKFETGTSIGSFLEWWDALNEKPSLQADTNSDSIQIMTIHKSKGLEFPVVFLPDLNWPLRANNREIRWFHLPDGLEIPMKYAPLPVNSKLQDKGLEKEWEIEQGENTFDNLNLLYVACTRASNALYLNFTKKRSGNISNWISSVGDRIENEDNSLGFSIRPAHSETVERKFELGHLDIPERKKEEELHYFDEALDTNYWDWRIDLESEKPKVGNEERIGTLFHTLIGQWVKNKDTSISLQRWELRGDISAEENKVLSAMIKSVDDDGWLRQEVAKAMNLSERDFLFDGKILRPDLVLIKEGKAVVVDFKTGSEKSEHHDQIAAYAEAAEVSFGVATEAYLIYLNPFKRVKANGTKNLQTSLF